MAHKKSLWLPVGTWEPGLPAGSPRQAARKCQARCCSFPRGRREWRQPKFHPHGAHGVSWGDHCLCVTIGAVGEQPEREMRQAVTSGQCRVAAGTALPEEGEGAACPCRVWGLPNPADGAYGMCWSPCARALGQHRECSQQQQEVGFAAGKPQTWGSIWAEKWAEHQVF